MRRAIRRRTRMPPPLVAVLVAVLAVTTLTRVDVAAAVAERLPGSTDAATAAFRYESPLGEVTYTPSRGLNVRDLGLTLGGYSNTIFARDEGEDATFELDDVSLFVVLDPAPRLHLFSEIEYADAVVIGEDERRDESLSVERLYADIHIDDAVNVKAGIFLTPIGRWNLIHAAPLVWTTSRPLTTEAFDPNLTGVMLFGTVFPEGKALTYYFFDQFGPPLEDDPEFDPADHSVGGRLELAPHPAWSIGTSYLAARRDGEWRQLAGLDLLWTATHIEVMSEMVLADGGGPGLEWGGYVQGVRAVTERLSLVGRYEHFAAPNPRLAPDLVSLGVAVCPVTGVLLKAEYLLALRSAPEAEPGFKASIAALF